MSFFLPVATRQVQFVVDGFEGKGLSGLQAVQKRNLPIPGKTGVDKFRLQNGKRYTIELTVTAKGNNATIQARVGGASSFSFQWTGPIADLSLIDPRFTLDDTRVVGLGAWESEVEFHKLEFRALTREARWTRPVAFKSAAPPRNYALSFNGRSHYVEIPKLAVPKQDDLLQSTHVTMEAWVRYPSVSTRHAFLNLEPGLGLVLANNDDGKKATLRTAKDLGAADYGTIPAQQMTHVACVYDGRQVRVYVDGKQRPATTKDATEVLKAFNPTKAYIGCRRGSAWYYRGVIDEVRISHAVRYTKEFVPQRRFQPDDRTTALYHFDEGQGTRLTDHSGNGYHGTIHGATWTNPDGTPIR